MRAVFIAATIACSLTVSAATAQMMALGGTPDSGLAGVWRIVGAQPTPWTKPRRLTKATAPLLEYAVEFAQGAVKGPAPLACPAAAYSAGNLPLTEMLGGKLLNDKTGVMAKALNLSQSNAYRIVCGGVAREYYPNDSGGMVLVEGDVAYTLARPTDMNPERYKAGFSGPSFDCTKAKTAGEKLICSDAELSATDRKLGAAYQALRKSETPESFASFSTAQRAWLAYAAKMCGADGPMPDNTGPVTDCLETFYGDRAALLGGLKVYRAGALVLEPRIRFRTRANPNTEESDIYPWAAGGPQAGALNAFIFRKLKLDKWRMDDKSLFRYGNDVDDMKLHARRFYAVEQFGARVVSLVLSVSDFVGGHGEEPARSALNWDMAKAAPISLADIFLGGRDWKKFTADYCNRDLRQKIADDDMPTDLDISEIRAVVANGDNWLWGKDKATVMFTILRNSGMPDGVYEVHIPYRALKPYMKQDAPVL